MSTEDVKSVDALEAKLRKLFDYEKELSKEIKETKEDTQELRNELNKVYEKMNEIAGKLDVIMHGQSALAKKKFKVYTDKEFYELKKENSWNELSRLMNCSVSTCKRKVDNYRKTLLSDMEV